MLHFSPSCVYVVNAGETVSPYKWIIFFHDFNTNSMFYVIQRPGPGEGERQLEKACGGRHGESSYLFIGVPGGLQKTFSE